MSTINDGGPAFPFTPTDKSGQIGLCEPGMSLRAYFAGKFMASEISNVGMPGSKEGDIVKDAIGWADALIAELNKKEGAK